MLNNPQLDAVPYGGLIKEDVMQKIWDISNIPLPFTDLAKTGSHDNPRKEFITDELEPPVTNNAFVEGADIDQDDSNVGDRLSNMTQISVKEVKVTDSSQSIAGHGGMNTLAYQLKERQKELRRDVEAQMLTHQASVVGDAATIPGISAGLGAQIFTNCSYGAGGSGTGFNFTTGLFESPTPGAPRALSEKDVRDVLQQIYEQGGNTDLLMARPQVIRSMSEYMFTDTAKVATMTNQQPGEKTAYGSVNVFVTDFGQTVAMKDNRIQPQDAEDVSTMYFLDPDHLEVSYLRGYQTEPLAKTGLSEKRLMSVQYTMCVLNEKSQGAIFDIDETVPMEA